MMLNKRVCSALVILIWLFLILFTIVKIFAPEWVALQVTNPRIIEIGEFVDNHPVVLMIIYFAASYFTYFVYLCACVRKWNLTRKQHIVVFVVNLFLLFASVILPEYAVSLDVVAMVILPLVFKSDYKQFVSVFMLHYIGQILFLIIRSQPVALAGVNWASQFILVLDNYLWLLLYYLISNKHKETTLWDVCVHLFSEMKLQKKLSERKSKKSTLKLTTSSNSAKNLKNCSKNESDNARKD